jgi:hypothetical protein
MGRLDVIPLTDMAKEMEFLFGNTDKAYYHLQTQASASEIAPSIVETNDQGQSGADAGDAMNSHLQIVAAGIKDDAGELRQDFRVGENATIWVNAFDPSGISETMEATISIYSDAGSGSLIFGPLPMQVERTDDADPPLWRTFTERVPVDEEFTPGNYSVLLNVSIAARLGAIAYAPMAVRSGVDIYPNNTGSGTPGTNKTYSHTIKNTGNGADIFDISVSSSIGFNISIYQDTNGNGVLDSGDSKMGTDSGGDGTWNWVNSSWDTNANGDPDTGTVLKSGTFKIIVEVQIPASYSGTGTDVTNVTVINKNTKATDWATDSTGIPEFTDILLPFTFMCAAVIFLYLRRRKGKACSTT